MWPLLSSGIQVEITPLPPDSSRPHPIPTRLALPPEGLPDLEEAGLPLPLNSVRSLTVGANTPTACCFSFVSGIPRKFVDDYYETSSQCSKPGVM